MHIEQHHRIHAGESGAKRPVRPVHVRHSRRASTVERTESFTYGRCSLWVEYELRLADRLELWARTAPERVVLAQRTQSGDWQTITYCEFLTRVRGLAAGLLRRGLSKERPLMIFSGNSIEHAVLALAATYVGIASVAMNC
jgi:feruloyl-CoA synthase